jgi:hypothetical protein
VFSHPQSTPQALLVLFGLLLMASPVKSAQAQQTTTPANALTPEELAKSVHNPFEDFIKLPIESDTGFSIGPHHNAGESLSVTPVLPFRLNTEWDLIARPSLAVTYQPSPDEQYGLADSQVSLFLTPHGASEWIWGIGPILQVPTATSDSLGTGRWSAGPTAAFLYSNGPWFNGILAYQLMSFAGNRDRGSVNQTYLEPDLSYNFESGWYVDTDPAITFDWTADAANAWTIPMGADIGKAFKLGYQDLSLQVGAYDFVKRPDGAPQWIIRVSVTLLFPHVHS